MNPESQTIEWPGEIDLDPEVPYGRYEPASGAHITRRTVANPRTPNADAQPPLAFRYSTSLRNLSATSGRSAVHLGEQQHDLH